MKTALHRGITPVVDGIKEEEKYGNDGGIIRTASSTFIRITEGASGAISKSLGVCILFQYLLRNQQTFQAG